MIKISIDIDLLNGLKMDVLPNYSMDIEELGTAELPWDGPFSLTVSSGDFSYQLVSCLKSGVENLICLDSSSNPDLDLSSGMLDFLVNRLETSVIIYQEPPNNQRTGQDILDIYQQGLSSVINQLTLKIGIKGNHVLFLCRTASRDTALVLSSLLEGSSMICRSSLSLEEVFNLTLLFKGEGEYERSREELEKELEEKKNRIIELQTIKGYADYKVQNLSLRMKNRLNKLQTKIMNPYYNLHRFLPGIDYHNLTVVIPYRRSPDADRDPNLDISLRYWSSIEVPHLLISEHSDISDEEVLMRKYSGLFETMKIVHSDSDGEPFNLAKAMNNGVIESGTPYLVIADLDCLTRKRNLDIALGLLIRGYDVVHPFNLRVTDIVDKESFQKGFDFKVVKEPEQIRSTADGGMMFWNKESFIKVGMGNENFSGWGGEDNELMYRAQLGGLKHYRIDDTLYHLYHHRPQKRTRNNVYQEELTRRIKSNEDLMREVDEWPWVMRARLKFSINK